MPDIPNLVLSAENGRSNSIQAVARSIGRFFVAHEFGIHDPTISRDHCQIHWRGRSYWIRDGDSNGTPSLLGTAINGRMVSANHWEPIPPHSSLRIGGTTFEVHWENPFSSEYDLMISYARRDEDAVLAIYDACRDLGIRPWLDQRDNRPAPDFIKDIEKILTEVSAVMVCWGGDCLGKTQAAEVDAITSLHVRRRIRRPFLVVLPGSDDPQWGLFLEGVGYYDLRKAGVYDELMRHLAKDLQLDLDAGKTHRS